MTTDFNQKLSKIQKEFDELTTETKEDTKALHENITYLEGQMKTSKATAATVATSGPQDEQRKKEI